MITYQKPTRNNFLNLFYHQVIFSEVGDVLDFKVPNLGFGKDLYTRRHLIMSGSFTCHWMVGGTVLGLYDKSDEDTVKNLVTFPNHNQPCDTIRLTALEQNSSYCCVTPLVFEDNSTVRDENFTLVQDQPFTTSLKRLYISTSKLLIENKEVEPFTFFTCVYKIQDIIPLNNGKIVGFYLI